MGKTKPAYSAKFKEQLVKLVKAGGSPRALAREFGCSDASIKVWVADTQHGRGSFTWRWCWTCTAVKVVGWSMSAHMTANLVLMALHNALMQRKAKDVIQRSDQGSQYTSTAFGKRCLEMGVRTSMGTVGDAYDNAMAESFFATLKHELLARRVLRTHADARVSIFKWIEGWCNPRRRHSGIGQVSPLRFEQSWAAKQTGTSKATELPAAATRSSQAMPAALDNSALWVLEGSSI